MKKSGLTIGLHSQTLRSADGTVAGSEITTAGLERAFLKSEEVTSTHRFSPGKYDGLEESEFDLIVIEGWHVSVPNFIQKIRASSSNTKILFWNLSFYGFNEVVKLDVDGYLSNSQKVGALLNKIKPSKFVMLAADIELFRPIEPVIKYGYDVVYLGMYHRSKSQDVMNLILKEASQFDLAIYGSGWDESAEFKPYWKGKLPTNDIPALYSSAKVVLGITEDRQRNAGMINNRVFEVLACGAAFVSEHSLDLERVFGNSIMYSRNEGDTKSHIRQVLENGSNFVDAKRRASALVSENHNYSNRVNQILDFYHSL